MVNHCLMAKQDDGISSNISNLSSSKFTLNELYDTFNELVEDFEKVSLKNSLYKMKIKSLEKEITLLKKEKILWIVKRKILNDEKEGLQKQNLDLKDYFEKLVEGKNKLEMILENKKKNGVKNKELDLIHLETRHGKTTIVRDSHQKHFLMSFSTRGKVVCNYCEKIEHSMNKCFIRNNPTRFKQIWISKEVIHANLKGPKKMCTKRNHIIWFMTSSLVSNIMKSKWFLDSGYSKHMTGDERLFNSIIHKSWGNVVYGDNFIGKIIGVATNSFPN